MARASLYNPTVGESLLAANDQTVLTNNLFVEAQYSSRIMDTNGVGSSSMDLLQGTPIWDRSRGQARFNAPTFCAVCPDAVNPLNNWDVYGKLNYFLSTKSLAPTTSSRGSTSSRRCGRTTRTPQRARTACRRPGPSSTARPSTRSSDVSDASTLSPRLGASYDIRGDGKWTANVSYAKYVGLFVTQIVDAASSAGRQASYSYFYQGPNVNTGSAPYLPAQQALQTLFDWFNANGGTNRPTRSQPTIPGVNTAVDPGVCRRARKRQPPECRARLGRRGPRVWTSYNASTAISTATSWT